MRLLDVPVNVTVELAVGAVSAAVRVMLCAAPGVRVRVEGVASTPAGRFVMATATVPVKDLIAFAVMLT